MTPEQTAALEVARAARAERGDAEKRYSRAMRVLFGSGLTDREIARGIGVRYDAVRMARRRSRRRL